MANYEITTKAGATYQLDLPDAMSETEVTDYFNNRYLPSLEQDTVNRPSVSEPSGDLTQFNAPVDQPTPEQIAQMQAEANPKDTSDFSRGFKTSYEQLPELGYGLEAGAYAIGESAFGEGGMLTQGKQEAVAKMIEAQKETQANAKQSDSFTYAYQKAKEGDFNALADTVQYGLGYGLGQMSQAVITGGLGSTVAKTAAETFAKEYTAKLVEQEALKVAEQTAARELTQEQIQQQAVKNVTESIANKGRDYALGAQAVGMEGGEILGDLAKQSTEQNRSLTAWEVTRGLGATALAAAGEFYADRFGLDILGGKRLSEAGKYTEGLKGNLLRGAATGLKGGGVEGGTEFAQTLIEEAGKGKDPFSSESLRQAIDATALGFIGGGAIGTVGGALSPAQQKPDQPATGEIDPSMLSGGLPNSTAQTTAQQPAQTSSDWQKTMGDIRGIVGENQLVDNETIAKDIAGAENIDDAIQVFNHVGEAISTDHVLNMEQASSFAQDLTKTDTEYLDNKDYQDAVQLESQLSTVRDELAYKKFQTAFEESNQQASRAEFNALVEQEINNKNQQLKDLIQYQSDERARKIEVEASVPSINKALEDAQWAKTRNNRNAVIQMVFDRNVPAENIFPAIKAELKRQGFKDTELSQDDIDSYNLLKAYDQNNTTIAKEPVSFGEQPVAARSASDIEFYNTGTNKVDKQGNIIADALGEQGANAGEQFTGGQGQDVVTNFVSPETPVRQESDALRKVDEWVSNGATYKNGMLIDSKGKKFLLNKAQREYYSTNKSLLSVAKSPVALTEQGYSETQQGQDTITGAPSFNTRALKEVLDIQIKERVDSNRENRNLSSVNQRIEEQQWAKTRNNRNAAIQTVFDKNVSASNIVPAIKAELKRQGFKDTELSEDDINAYELLRSSYGRRNPEIANEPVDIGVQQPVSSKRVRLVRQGVNAGEQVTEGQQGQDVITNFVEPSTPVRQESDALRKVDEWLRAGATYKNGMLFDSKGKKFVLNTVQREYYLNNRPAPIAKEPVDMGEVGNAPRKRYMGVKQQGVNAGEQMTGSISQDQISGVEEEQATMQPVAKKKPATNNLRAITGLEPIETAIGKLGGINREMANRAGFSNFKGWYFTKTSSEGFDGMALQLADKGYDVDGENDLIAKLRESLDADFGTGKKVYTSQGIDNAIDKMAADKADQDQQEQDELLNTYTNEELNAILDAKTQAEKNQLIKDFKAEKKRKGDQEVDTVADEMKGTGMTTSGDLFAPKIKEPIAKIPKLERNLTEDEVATINELVFGSDEFLYLPASNKGILISKFNEYSKENPDKAKAYLTDLYNELYSEDDSNIKFSKAKAQERLAPNGKPSNLNATQYEQVRTPEFKAWFGDWENDPENASKVVDENGEPLVAYHGTNADFNEFQREFIGQQGTAEGKGFYFTTNQSIAESYGNVKSVFLNIRNPMDYEKLTITKSQLKNVIKTLDPKGIEYLTNYGDVAYDGYNSVLNEAVNSEYESSDNDVDLFHSILNATGDNYDAVIPAFEKVTSMDGTIVQNPDWGEHTIFVALNPNQIKSATDNTGEFSKESNDIRFSQTQEPTTDNHTEQSLKEGLTQAGDNAYGKGWTDRLLATGMFEIISDTDAQKIVNNAVEISYSKNGDIEAFFNPADGKTYFVAENISKDKDLHYLMMHEVSVHMLNMGANKEEFEKFLKATDNLVKVKNPAAMQGRQDALDADTPQEDLREETLAYLVKYVPKLKVVQQFKAWLKNALRNMGKMFPAAQRLGFIQWANNLSDQDLLYIANATLRKAPELLLKKSSEYEVAQAQEYFDRTGFMPYLSEGQLEIPVELAKFAIKTAAQAKWGIHSVLGIPMNKNETVSLYYPTTNEIARRVLQEGKLVADNPNANRIYLTNESAGYSVMENRGAITNEMDGAVVLLQIDPSLVQIDDSVEHKDGRRDFFIPIGEGEAFMKKPKMLKLFTLNQPREQGIAETTTLAEVGERIAKAVEEYKGLTDRQKATRYTRAKKVLKRYHNITTFLTENRKLEKTRVGDYGLTYEGNSVASQGLGLASAQKINNKNLSTCPVSAICEELCLGETSGQNLLYGGKGKYRSGARLSQYLKTEAMVLHPEEFAIAIAHEIKLYESWANQTFEYVRDPANPKRFLRDPVTNDRLKIDKEIYQPAMRLNVTSDIPPTVFEPIMRAYPNVEFYDYTKLNSDSKLPNLHITYSSTGVSQIVDGVPIFNKHSNWRQSVQRLDTGFNVAMVFSDKNDMPKTVTDEATGKVYQVWNGDNYDARFLDPKRDDGIGMIIGLTNKDNTGGVEDATERTKGFFVNYNKKRDGDNVTILDQSKFNARAETYNGEKVTPSIKFSKSKKAKEGEVVNRSTGYTAYDQAKPIQEEVDNKANYPEEVSLEEEHDWVVTKLRRYDSFRRLNDKSNEVINKYLTTMGRLPELGKYLGMRYKTLGKIDNVDDIVRNVFDTLHKATKEDAKEIYTYLTDNKATTEFILDPEMALMAKDLKDAIKIVGMKLVEFNIIPMESYQMYEGRYLPRVYLEHIIQSSDRYQSLGSGKTLSSMGYAKRRDNNIPEEVRRLLKGEIKNPAYLASRTLSIPLRDIAMMEFFNQISDNEKWVWKQSLINIELDAKTNRPTAIFDDDGVINYNATNSALEGKPKKVVVRKVTPYFLDKEADRILDQSYSAPEEDRKDMQDLANMMKRAAAQAMSNMDVIPADFVKMPNVAKYGSLRGLVVHKLIYDDLVGTINTYGAAGEQTALENFFGNNGLLYRIANAFKFSHVALNIPTQVMNLLSNGILLHTSGVRFDKVPIRVFQAFKEILNDGENYRKMVDMGGRKATFSNQELQGITDWLLENEAEFSDKDMDWFSMVHLFRELSYLAGKGVRGASNFHQAIEMVFKTAKFIDLKSKGANDLTAAVMAHKALFDYSFVPRWVKWLRSVPFGIPFITWTVKSFESSLRTFVNRPTSLLPYYMLGYAMSLAAAADFGDDGEDKLKAILKLLPERMQRAGNVWVLPMKDDSGRTQVIDMNGLFPWSKTVEGINSLGRLVGNQDVAELRNFADSVGVFSSPITQALVAIDTNRDTFSGKQIIDENDSSAQKLQSVLEYSYNVMGIPMFSPKGDIATIYKSQFPSEYEGIMNKDGSPKKTEQQAFLHLMTGLSVKSVDIDFEKYKKLSAFENMVTGIEAQLSKELSSNPNLDAESRDRVVKKYTDRIDRVMEKRDKFEKETSVLN